MSDKMFGIMLIPFIVFVFILYSIWNALDKAQNEQEEYNKMHPLVLQCTSIVKVEENMVNSKWFMENEYRSTFDDWSILMLPISQAYIWYKICWYVNK